MPSIEGRVEFFWITHSCFHVSEGSFASLLHASSISISLPRISSNFAFEICKTILNFLCLCALYPL